MFNIFDLFNNFKITLTLDQMLVVCHALSSYNREMCNYSNELTHNISDFTGDEYIELIEHTWRELDLSIDLLIKLQNKLKFRGINDEN